MKFLRVLFALLALITLLAAVVVGALFLSPVQTWIVQRALARNPDLPVTVESVSADLASVSLTNLRIQSGGVTLEVPSLEAKVSLLTAWREHRLPLQGLVAKGWKLDLGPIPPTKPETIPGVTNVAEIPLPPVSDAAAPPSTVTAASRATDLVRALMRKREVPLPWSLDGLELEGEIVVNAQIQNEVIRVPVVLQGGGFSGGRTAEFTLGARLSPAEARRRQDAFATQGKLVVAVDSAMRVASLVYTGSLLVGAIRPAPGLELRAEVAAPTSEGPERYSLQVSNGGRTLAGLEAAYRPETQRFAGSWQSHANEADLAQIFSVSSSVGYSLEGRGDFLTQPSLAGVHVAGEVVAKNIRWTGLMPTLDQLGASTGTASFELDADLTRTRFEKLKVSLANERPVVWLEALQPFQLNWKGELEVTQPAGDWLTGTVTDLPLSFLSNLTDKLTLTGGDMSGDFVVQVVAGTFKFRSPKPFTARGVSVGPPNRPWLKGLDLSLTLAGERSPKGWLLQATPLVLSADGGAVATIEAKFSPLERSGRGRMTTGRWRIDVEKLAPHCEGGELLVGKSAEGEFSVTSATRLEWRTTLNLSGLAPGKSLSASVRASVDPYGFSYDVPLTITEEGKKSELFVHVGGGLGKAGYASEVEVTGVDVTLSHLEPLLGPLARAGGFSWPALLQAGRGEGTAFAGAADLRPFWGEGVGRGKVQIYRLDLGEHELTDLRASFAFGPDAFRLEEGKAFLGKKPAPPPSPARGRTQPAMPVAPSPRTNWTAEGTVTFDRKDSAPYTLGATLTVHPVDSTLLLPGKSAGTAAPSVEGRFKVRDTISSGGRSLLELLARRQDEFRAVSAGGTFGFLHTNVAQSLPDAPTPVKDALAGVGSTVAALFGVNTRTMPVGLNKLSKPMEAVLNLTYEFSQIRYDHLAVTAIRDTDGALRITEFSLVAPFVRLAGSGRIEAKAGLPFGARPMILDLQLSARDRMGSLLSTAGLMSAAKDDRGFAPLNQTVRFGGTPEAVDNSAWHDLLVKAASPPSQKGK